MTDTGEIIYTKASIVYSKWKLNCIFVVVVITGSSTILSCTVSENQKRNCQNFNYLHVYTLYDI